MATTDVRKGFLEAILQWTSTVSVVTKTTTIQNTILFNQQQLHNENVVMAKTSNQRDVAIAPSPMRYSCLVNIILVILFMIRFLFMTLIGTVWSYQISSNILLTS